MRRGWWSRRIRHAPAPSALEDHAHIVYTSTHQHATPESAIGQSRFETLIGALLDDDYCGMVARGCVESSIWRFR